MEDELEQLKTEILTHYQESILIADFAEPRRLILMAKPYLDLQELMMEICETLSLILKPYQRLVVELCQFGINEYIEIDLH